MDATAARALAEDWIAAWNAHDLEKILSHYADDIVFLSPVAARLVGNGRVEGMAALRSYWRRGLDAIADLRFALVDVLVGHACLTILYRNQRGQLVAETLELGVDGKVVRAAACYAS